MGSIEKRICRLEAQEAGWGGGDTLLLDRALARLAHEDMLVLTEYLDRTGEEDGEPTEEEEAVLLRLEERFEEVRNGG